MSRDRGSLNVIGVIMMIFVTVILSALVATLSLSMMEKTKPAPNAMIEFVSIKRNMSAEDYADGFYIKFLHRGGDPIPFKELRVVLDVYGEHDGWVPQHFTVVLGSYSKDAIGVSRHAEYPDEVWNPGDFLLIKTVKEYDNPDSGSVGLLNGEREVLLGVAIQEGRYYTYNINVKFIHIPSKVTIQEFNLCLPELKTQGYMI